MAAGANDEVPQQSPPSVNYPAITHADTKRQSQSRARSRPLTSPRGFYRCGRRVMGSLDPMRPGTWTVILGLAVFVIGIGGAVGFPHPLDSVGFFSLGFVLIVR